MAAGLRFIRRAAPTTLPSSSKASRATREARRIRKKSYACPVLLQVGAQYTDHLLQVIAALLEGNVIRTQVFADMPL